MKLHDFLHRTCVIITLSNGATVCGVRGLCAHCTGYFQHEVLYTIVKYSIQYGWKNLWTEGILSDSSTARVSANRNLCYLQKVYGNGALKYATFCKWVHCFDDGQESIENDPWVGRPVSVLTEKNVATVKTLIEEDARYTVQEIEELSGIHSSSVLKILRERLGLRKICARWVPFLLTDEQKQSWVRLALQVIENMINVTHVVWKR